MNGPRLGTTLSVPMSHPATPPCVLPCQLGTCSPEAGPCEAEPRGGQGSGLPSCCPTYSLSWFVCLQHCPFRDSTMVPPPAPQVSPTHAWQAPALHGHGALASPFPTCPSHSTPLMPWAACPLQVRLTAATPLPYILSFQRGSWDRMERAQEKGQKHGPRGHGCRQQETSLTEALDPTVRKTHVQGLGDYGGTLGAGDLKAQH